MLSVPVKQAVNLANSIEIWINSVVIIAEETYLLVLVPNFRN